MTTLALLLPLLALGGPAAGAVTRPKEVEESLNLDNGLNRGQWGPIAMCTRGSYVFGFEIKYSGLGFMDDTSVNAIRLYCQNTDSALTDLITSSEGSYGQWKGMRTCPGGEYMTGMRANVVPDMGPIRDDLGMDNLQMRCSDGHVLDGLYGVPNKAGQGSVVTNKFTRIGGKEVEAVHLKIRQSAHTRDFGNWGTWSACSATNKVCGLQIRLEDHHPLEDDAGVTDVVMYCCN